MVRAALREQRLATAVVGVLALAVLVTGLSQLGSGAPAAVRTVDETITVPGGPTSPGVVKLSTTTYLPPGARGRSPAVIVSPGFGQTKEGVRGDALDLARRGYVVLAWTMRGVDPFSIYAGRIALDAPDTEVQDLRALISHLARRPDVLLDRPGDPRVALMGQSYGGGISLMGAAYDRRVDATAPVITWNSLESALLPGDVFKAEYAAVFFAGASSGGCLRFAVRLCRTYERIAQTGRATAADRALLRASSPDPVLGRITVPTLLIQGENDTLFPLSESLRTATRLRTAHVPVGLVWLRGGHDQPFGPNGDSAIRALTARWFDHYLRRDRTGTGPVFRWDRANGRPGTSGQLPPLRAQVTVALHGAVLRQVSNPAGGRPASISSVPGAGNLGGIAAGLGFDVPGQSANWETATLSASRELVGTGALRLHVRSSTGEAVLFAKVLDIGPSGSAELPGGAVAPIRLARVGGAGRDVVLTLPTLAHVFPAGHRIRVSVASTDLGFAGPLTPAAYELSLRPATALTLPLVPLSGATGYAGLALVWSLIGLAVLLVAVAVLVHRRRRPPDLGDDYVPPVVIRGLAKSYADGFRAVDGIDLVVERGMVLGLLGPNGAGKTTTLRMLAGLIAPSAGEALLFGRPVRSGAPVLSRVGFFVEGPGLLPHLTGAENLRLYWMSTADSMAGSFVEEALEIAGLGIAVDRPVRTYSHGMRQRLALAQAMLGRPDLLVLDEPTNGLDPPQIKEVREVLRAVAASGRTVLVSSHLLSEVEQTCSHVAVMSRGRMVAQGPVQELLADDGSVRLEVAGDDRARAVSLLERMAGVTGVTETEGALLVDLAGTSRGEVVTRLVKAGVVVLGVSSRRRLEDVFLELLGGSP